MRLFTLSVLIFSVLFQYSDAKQLRVAIIDTGLNLSDKRFQRLLCETGHHDFTGEGIRDWHGHGTHVAGLIKEHAGSASYCLMILKFYDDDETSGIVNTQRVLAAIKHAVKEKADIVNISAEGKLYSEEEYETIRNATNTLFMVAAGNNGGDIDKPGTEVFPAGYALSNIIPVGSLDNNGNKAANSGYGERVHWEVGVSVRSTAPCDSDRKPECYAVMSGASMATAVATGKVISGLLKPKTTCGSGVCKLPKK